jgi:deoxycytidine triphosphate deaminase
MFIGQKGISAALHSGQLQFTGAMRGDGLLLSAGACLLRLRPNDDVVDPLAPDDIARMYRSVEESWGAYILNPQELVLIQSKESIAIGQSLIGVIGTLSHVARIGLMAHLASPFINPGFFGYVTLEVFNASCSPIKISEGMPLAKIMIARFTQGRTAPKRSFYGEYGALGTRYSEDPDANRK